MKILQKLTISFLILFFTLSLQGCIVAAVGAGIAAVKYGNSKKKSSYNQYILGMEQINIEREKAHMKSEPILTYKEYDKT